MKNIFARTSMLGTILLLCALASAPAQANAIVLYKFSGTDGSEPYGPLIADTSGNIYGTTTFGGTDNRGVVFELSPAKGTWKEILLHSFGGSDGAYPNGGLLMDANGNLYGTTFSGGSGGGGVAYELSPARHGAWTFSQLVGFGGPQSAGGSNPNGSLVHDDAGNLYGTTQLGGSGVCSNFPGPCGVVFELSPAQGGAWQETVLYSFAGVPDGEFPYSDAVFDANGNLIGTTSQGGTGKCTDGEGTIIGCGTVFELQQGSSWSETPLHEFQRSEQNMPGAPLVFGKHGALYSVAGYDVFRLKPPARPGAHWEKQTIYQFTEGIAGTIPSGGVMFDSRGNLYGTTASSGLDGYSTAFELSPPAKAGGTWTETTLAHFGRGFRPDQPRGGILIGIDGTLYGAVSGTPGYIFAIAR